MLQVQQKGRPEGRRSCFRNDLVLQANCFEELIGKFA